MMIYDMYLIVVNVTFDYRRIKYHVVFNANYGSIPELREKISADCDQRQRGVTQTLLAEYGTDNNRQIADSMHTP